MLQSLEDLPIRAGFLFDISASMLEETEFNRSVIQMYASRLIRKGVDQAFVMQFDTQTLLAQDWTDEDSAIAVGSAAIGPRYNRQDPLTAIFDSLYTTCRDRWGAKQAESTGNFILLFSDGEDDASHAYLSEAVDMCQRRHIAIYVFEGGRTSHFTHRHSFRLLRFSQSLVRSEMLFAQPSFRVKLRGHDGAIHQISLDITKS